jgi:hypothetical protein
MNANFANRSEMLAFATAENRGRVTSVGDPTRSSFLIGPSG